MIRSKPRRKLFALTLAVLIFGSAKTAEARPEPPPCVEQGTCFVTGADWGEVWQVAGPRKYMLCITHETVIDGETVASSRVCYRLPGAPWWVR